MGIVNTKFGAEFESVENSAKNHPKIYRPKSLHTEIKVKNPFFVCHFFVNNFFHMSFSATFSTDPNQHQILRFLIPLLPF
jgi:hypothetical protein